MFTSLMHRGQSPSYSIFTFHVTAGACDDDARETTLLEEELLSQRFVASATRWPETTGVIVGTTSVYPGYQTATATVQWCFSFLFFQECPALRRVICS